MLQLFLQIPDRSTATSRGRSYVREMSFHDAETLLCSTADFHDVETPLCSTGDFLPDAETPLFSAFHFFPFPKQLRPAPVSPFSLLLLKHHYQQLFIFPFPLLKHRYQQPFTIFPDAETPLFNIFHFFPLPKHSSPPFSHYFHYRNNSVQHLFRLSPFCC
jgi:hypothetical protein